MSHLLADIDWNALLQQPDTFPMLVTMGMATMVALGSIIAVQWRKVRVSEDQAMLKARMIDRGFTADEIASVLAAGSKKSRKTWCELPPGKDVQKGKVAHAAHQPASWCC